MPSDPPNIMQNPRKKVEHFLPRQIMRSSIVIAIALLFGVLPIHQWSLVPACLIMVCCFTYFYADICAFSLRQKVYFMRRVLGFCLLSLTFMVGNVLTFAVIFRQLGISVSGTRVTHNIFSCLYFSSITWTTIGYGDFTPTANARFFAALEGFIGYVFMALLISTLIHVFGKLEIEDKQ